MKKGKSNRSRNARIKRGPKRLGSGWAAKQASRRQNRRGKRSKSTGYQL